MVGADGRRHVLRYRMFRVPTGIAVRLCEDGVPAGAGYEFEVLGDHDADPAKLMAAARAEGLAEIGRSYLEPEASGGWQVVGDQVAGRLVHDPDGGPHQVVVDGRALSWAQLGEALSAFEGWRFRLLIDDPAEQLRPAENDR
jgi:hypothetical protein